MSAFSIQLTVGITLILLILLKLLNYIRHSPFLLCFLCLIWAIHKICQRLSYFPCYFIMMGYYSSRSAVLSSFITSSCQTLYHLVIIKSQCILLFFSENSAPVSSVWSSFLCFSFSALRQRCIYNQSDRYALFLLWIPESLCPKPSSQD